MEDRPHASLTRYATSVLAAHLDLGPLHKLYNLNLLKVHDKFLFYTTTTLVEIVEGPRKLLDRYRGIGSVLNETHLEVSFSRLRLSLNGLQVDISKAFFRTIAVLNTPITADPDVSNIGVITFINCDYQIEVNVICPSDVAVAELATGFV